MRILKKMAKNVIRIDEDKLLKQIYDLKDFQALVIDLNTNEQLFEGIDSKGNSLGNYAPFTIQEKKAKGQPTNRITLKDTGEFYNSFSVRSTNNGFIIIANAIKEDNDLVEDFGKEILGLTDLSISQVQLFLLDELIPLVKAKIFKGLR